MLGRPTRIEERARDFLTDPEIPVLDREEGMHDWQQRSLPRRPAALESMSPLHQCPECLYNRPVDAFLDPPEPHPLDPPTAEGRSHRHPAEATIEPCGRPPHKLAPQRAPQGVLAFQGG